MNKKALSLFVFSAALTCGFAYSTTIPDDLIVEGTTELQDDTEVHGDLQVIGSQSQILLGSDGMAAFQNFGYSGTAGFFWDPGQMAIRAGRVIGSQWNPPLGLYSAAFGYNVTASGTHSVALNQSTRAGGGSALATGKETIAVGDASVSLGYGTVAETFASVVLGRFNERTGGSHNSWVAEDPLFVIGNGAGSAWNQTKNAVTVLKNGNTGLGTSTPQAKLDVRGDARFTGQVLLLQPQGDLSMGPFTSGPQ